MSYNIHPIFVHFPIALLTIYGILELVRFRRIKDQPYWFYVKAVMVIIGAAAGWVTFLTGEMAEGMIPAGASVNWNLLNTHSTFALLSVIIFSVLAVGYIIAWFERAGYAWTPLSKLKWLIVETPLVWLLALAGVACILITGALGGSIVYGPTNDPGTEFIYHLLIKE